ncbi:MAG: GTPase ObgE [Candidatus Harrisonbacteria bacterium]|nr:GTPase ObgE [Candidatus Harrisonbacteria bacterium]
MLIDDVTITVASGNGGRGAVAFNKNMMSLGPAGGSGGNGGSVYCEGVVDLSALRQFRFKKDLAANNGENGKAQFNDGKDGQDLILKVPVGTVIHNLETSQDAEITAIGERTLVAKGGHGGKGNFLFRSPRNTSPKRFQEGLPGEKFTLRLELKLIADVGLIGLPNAGKSSLLNELTSAKSKVANYPFTTLEPNLGTYYELILADLPGLIEGASGGKGLGIKFLRHVERTKILFHLISAESAGPVKEYKIIRKELGAYNKELLKKKEYLFLSKSDAVSPANLKKKLAVLKKLNPSVIAISIYDFNSIEKVKKILNGIIKNKYAKK